MIDNNIISSLGAGSGIDTQNLIKQLTAIERAAPQERIDNRRDLTETRISDFGLLRSALATLQDAAEVLVDPEALSSKSASFTESDSLVPTDLGTDALPGTYSFSVQQVAKAHTIAFAGVSDPKAEIGEGTITFNFGAWSRDVDGIIDGAFSQDTDHDSVEITIDSDNNSLQGLRDAINDADFGVSASIVFDGTDYRLTLVAASGEQNELEISVTESGDPGLADFAFVQADTSADAQGGANAIVTLNGVQIERSSNTIDDIVEGLTLDVLKPTDVGETVTITVEDDKDFAEQNIRDFVAAYNAFLEAVDPIFGINEVENDDGETETVVGSLQNDALAKSILTQIRTKIASSIPGLSDSNLTALTNVGIRTELDGTLSIDEDDFSDALEDHFDDVVKVFSPYTSTSDDNIFINSYNAGTTAGEYEVVVTQAPTKGEYNGNALATTNLSGMTLEFQVKVNALTSAQLTIDAASYASGDEIAAALQSAINNDSVISEGGGSVTVSFNGTGFDIQSNSYGSSSNVSIIAPTDDVINQLGLAEAEGTAGLTAEGTINGETAFGSANVLLPPLTSAGSGLALVIGENATSATVNFSRGFAGELEDLIDSFLDTAEGVIETRTDALADSLETLDTQQDQLDRRMSAYEERLLRQFIAMERILSSLNTSGSFLDNLVNTLPFTANNNK